ncbi:unnamed protein product [Triticum turgidum subsp. durum]|uniref:Protein transport protein SEC23 n=1 Tax=Triticum turgidum subsp. durum TaxID=4567 RepID=A0A9R0T1A0_TRITD|nr:unnamed protein product [Triticum turgidum subsp. durum]
MSEFLELEARDGVRMTWNVIPGTKQDAASCVVPVSAIYTPLNPNPAIPVLPYAPLRCRSCRSILNPFSVADFSSKMWLCPFCFQRNHFPQQYSAVSLSNLPTELYPECCTVEYMATAETGPVLPPVFLFVVDTCMIEEEIGYLKSALAQAVELLPDQSLVGFITFGTYVQVHELGFGLLPKSHVFKGTKEIKKDQILEQMGFLTGKTKPTTGGRIMAFIGGPSTEGPGSIISKPLSDPIRSHKDLDKGSAPLYNKAVKFYEEIGNQLVHQGHVLDLFACALDQVGVAEMKVAVERTGGIVVLAESFGHSVFKDSLRRIFQSSDSDLGLSFKLGYQVRNDDIRGRVGVALIEKKLVQHRLRWFGHIQRRPPEMRVYIGRLKRADNVKRGRGRPNLTWKESAKRDLRDWNITKELGMDRAAYLRSTAPRMSKFKASLDLVLPWRSYQHHDGQMRLRSTTISRRWVAGSGSVQELITGFDQEAAAAVMARLVSFKMEAEVDFDPVRWLDRALISLCSKFGDYQKEAPSSFSLSPRLSIFPQFIFNLRRSQFIQVFNNSPDETAYFRMMLNRENVANAVVMIQPSLISYSFQSGPEPVLLDVSAIAGDRILLLDSYFTVVIFHGITIAQWRKAGYQNQEGHEVFAQLLQAPQEEADSIIKERFPVPRLVVCDQYGSQARFLLAKLNPSVTYDSDHPPPPGGDMIFTDDASFQVFMEHLQRLAVQ